MSASQPLLYSDWTTLRQPIVRRLAFPLVAMIVGTLLFFPAGARAQVPTSLVTLATDQTQLNLSNHFGVPSSSVVDQAGDYAFIGEGGSALFLRLAGASAATRLLQFGDPVPNLTGATIVDFASIGGLNSSVHILFAVDYNVIPVDGRLHRAILLYTSGTSYTTIATSDLTAPGTGGKSFGPSLGFAGQATAGGALDNNNDVLFETTLQPFAGTATGPNQDTIYIAPAAGAPVRVVGFGDSLTGAPAPLVSLLSITPINALGQFFFNGLFANTPTTVNGLFLASVSGITKVVVTGDPKPSTATGTFTISNTTMFALNNSGQAAFVDPGTPASTPPVEPGIWFYSSGNITNIYTAPSPLPGASTIVQLSALSDPGEAVGQVSIGTGISAIVRVHSNGQTVDTVASTDASAPGITGATAQSFSGLSVDNTDRVTFYALTSGPSVIYQQTGTATPQIVALGGQTTPVSGGGTFVLNSVTKALNNGSTFFTSVISGGTATYGQFVGAQGSISVLMSTADTLPPGARVRISNPKWAGGNQGSNELYLAFDANLAGGESALFERDIVAGATTRIVGEGNVLSALGGTAFFQRSTPSGLKPYYMNDFGQIAFPAMLTNGTEAILLAQPTGGFTVIASTGQTAPLSGSPTFGSFDFSSNTTSLTPINDSGQVAFYGALSNAVVGIFLGDGNQLVAVAFTGETVPEGGATFSPTPSFSTCSSCSLAINNNGQVAFGANKSGGSGIYIYTGGTLLNVAYSAEAEPQGGTFGLLDPISSFSDSGQVVFEPQGGGGGGGVYKGTGGPPTEVAIAGAAAPGTGSGTLLTDTTNFTVGGFLNFVITANAAIDDCGNVAFQSKVTGGTANSGYFGIVGSQCSGGASGSLQALALQGQVVSGAGTLGTIFTSSPNNSFFALGDNNIGELWFTNSFTTTGGATMVGQFLAISAGSVQTVQKLMAPGDAISGTGGVYAQATPAPVSTNQGGVGLYEVLTTGGTASQALVLAVEEGGTIPTSTTVTSSQSPSGVGVPVTFTATVTSTGSTPAAGDFVAFFDSGVAIGIGLLNGSQQAAFTAYSLTAGSHSITAEYFPNSGANNNNSGENLKISISPAITQTVSNATTTEFFSLTNPSLPGQSVEFEGIVFATAGSTLFPTGTVNFFDGATQIGTGTLADEVVIFSTSSLTTATHVITAQYSGDSNFAASTSNPVDQVVQTSSGGGLLPSATALASSVNPSFSGQSVTFVAPVDGGSGGAPTGIVNFLDGTTSIGTGPVVTTAQGTQAMFTTSSLSIGAHSITAVYSGDSSFAGSTSNVVIQTVTTAVSAVLLSITVTPATSSIAVGNTQAFAAIGTFSDGTMLDLTPSVTWNSTQQQFATINSNGIATAVSPGATQITAQEGLVTSGPATLTVSSATLSSIAVTPINPFTTELRTQPFTATGTYSDGSVADLTSRVTWQSSASGIASISESGVASTGESTGTTTISATLGAVSNSTTLTVVQNEASPHSFNLAFYANNGPAEGVSGNISDYAFNFGGTFQIASTALGVPNNLVLYRDPAFLKFDAPIFTNSNFFDFNLGNKSALFPGDAYPFNNGTKTDPVQGLRMDSSGNPLRFDTPSTLSGSSAVIRFFNGQTPSAELTLADNDSFNYVMLANGTLLQRSSLGVGQTPVGNVGNWTFNGGPGDGTIYSGVYVIYPVAAITSASSAAFAVGTNGTFTVTSVGYPTPSLSEAGTLPNGVSFQDNGDGTGTLSGMPGVGSAGTYPITFTASNGVDPNFTQNFTLTVTTSSLLPTNTGLTSLPNPSSFGQSATFTATVTDSAEVPPNGNVTFFDNTADSQLGSVQLSGGVATFSTSSLSSGSHSVTASYAGDGANFLGSTSTAVTQVVQPVLNSSNTILTSSLNPAAFGQSVVLTAIVYSSATGTPTGSVRFMDISTEAVLGTGTLSNGQATLTTSSLPLGSNSLQAIYLGDSNFQTSTSASVQQTINHGPTATAVASSLNPAAGGQSVQFSAIVTSPTGETPTGTVTFFDGETSLGTGTLNASGIATFSTSSLGVGAHSITAQYPNGAIFNGSTSTPLTETITLNLTTTAIISSLNPSPSTDFVQFSAIVTSVSGGAPAGTVNFEDNTNDVQIGSAQLNASGVATFGTSSLSIGTHSITAQYVGNASFGASTSSPVVQSVTINATPTTAPTFVSIASSPNPSAVGQTVVITATVSSSTAGTPTGNMTFLDNGAPIGATPLATGSTIATFSTSTLSAGSHPLTAQYSGDANYALSLSAVLSQTVGSGGTQATTIQVTPIPQNVAPATQVVAPCPSIGEYCQQFTATVQNGGSSPTVTWAVLSGPGTIGVNTGFYMAPSDAPTTQVTISATVGNSSASISFTLGADALTSPQTPATVTAGTPLSVSVQLEGVPTNSTVPFVLSCGSLPAATTCTFSNNSSTPAGCPMGTITSVTGACPNFTVTVSTSGGTSGSTRLMPAPGERGRPWQGGPWFGLFAIVMSALAFTRRRRGVLLGSRSYACCALVLLCVCVMFLSSCGAFFQSTNSVPAPTLMPLTPSGSYQVVVLATPPGGSAGGGFVQTQLIVPVIVN